jgi:tetratricopeptide (TPR) repeat protein
MKCTKTKKLISDYIDGELDAKTAASLEGHLKACPACRRLCADFRRIAGRAKTLPKREPSGQAWFRIRTRLKEASREKVSPVRIHKERFLLFPARLRTAVSTVLLAFLVGGGIFIGYRVLRQGEFSKENRGQEYALKKIQEAEEHYQLAIKALWEAVQMKKDDFDPQMAQTFLTSLKLIDVSLAECKKAVEGDPGNLDSRYYLLAVYEKKVELLDDMMEIPEVSPENKESKTIF